MSWWHECGFTEVAGQDDTSLHVELTEEAMELAARLASGWRPRLPKLSALTK
ncbi:hypothetical protein [Streptomyces sp. NPDC005244]|uniref:hypothetical protein n=1 Tax=Streptomyces sp. NPDC005244 TaxID=3364708 RepID=UPI0036B8D195